MPDDQHIWVGQSGRKYGPFDEATVRQWMDERKFAADAVGCRGGRDEWLPLATLMHPEASSPSVSPGAPGLVPPPPPPPAESHYRQEPPSGPGEPPGAPTYQRGRNRSTLPGPPTLHWALVWVFATLTLGLFGYIWLFIQANWVRRVDRDSKATLLLTLGIVATVVGLALQLTTRGALGGHPSSTAALRVLLGGLFVLTGAVLFIVSWFSMASSIRRVMEAYDVEINIGGITLFFFNTYYLQSVLTWIGRWRRTGQTEPAPPKAIIWLLMFAPVCSVAILAAIALPAYQDYVSRVQVSEGISISRDVRSNVASYYAEHGSYPIDNEDAELPPSNEIQGKFVSMVDVDHGKVVVLYGSGMANRRLIGKSLVFLPTPDGDKMTWDCKSESTVDERFLPVSCRR